MAQYKCVLAAKEIVIKSKNDYDTAVRSFADLINKEANEGWTFYSMESIAVTQKAGCLMALIGQEDTTVYFNMLIFVKN
jgi:hypothetical protein